MLTRSPYRSRTLALASAAANMGIRTSSDSEARSSVVLCLLARTHHTYLCRTILPVHTPNTAFPQRECGMWMRTLVGSLMDKISRTRTEARDDREDHFRRNHRRRSRRVHLGSSRVGYERAVKGTSRLEK